MRIVVIGGSGHVGTFLVPRLVRAGHEVITITRGLSTRYADAPEWQQVRQVVADRQAQDADGTFGDTVLALAPDAVIDLVCFTLDSATALVDALRGHTGQLVHCGSIWRHGASRKLPITEDSASTEAPPEEYGIQKDLIARMLKQESAAGGLVTTSLHPGHIVGPGWFPIGPLGNLDPEVWRTLAAGRPLQVPDSGVAMMHHVHADDVAQAFELAIQHRDAAAGEDFSIVAPSALSTRGYAQIVAGWFGQTATLEPVTWDEYRAGTAPEHAAASWDHLHRSQCFSIEKARALLGYAPRYEPEQAVLESLRRLVASGRLKLDRPLIAQ